ncbi:MAG: apolipoprotein N-acyltransferase [Rhodospirillales bacterium]|nr:apolipoprotein N-acyltransferase [Rhodospirillales bacterium]
MPALESPPIESDRWSAKRTVGHGTVFGIGHAFVSARAWIAESGTWRRIGLAFALGAVAVLALPPYGVVPVLFPAFTALLWLIESSRRARMAFACGWAFGFGFFLAGLYWISYAFLVDGDRFGWMVPLAVPGLAAVAALYVGLATALTHATLRRAKIEPESPGRVLVFAAWWAAAELLRGWALTGFPWNLIGSVWVVSDAMIQLASVTGIYGLSLITVAAAAAPATLADDLHRWSKRAAPFLVSLAVLAAIGAGGAARLALGAAGTVPDVRLRLVQPNIAQKEKWLPELRDKHLIQHLDMSVAPRAAADGTTLPRPTHVIWSETAVQYLIDAEPNLLEVMARAVPPDGLIIAGAIRAARETPTRVRYLNSLHAIDDQGRIVATYDKFHLVPFGEYVPLRGLLDLSQVALADTDFGRGPGLTTLRLAGLPPLSPLICYEVIFPGHVAKDSDRPQWILNLTNDAWYRLSSGPHQHFAAARMRAVEEGLPLVRVANTGISAVIDPYGRIKDSLALGQRGTIDSALPQALANPPLFAVFGNGIAVVLLTVCLALGMALGRWKRTIDA